MFIMAWSQFWLKIIRNKPINEENNFELLRYDYPLGRLDSKPEKRHFYDEKNLRKNKNGNGVGRVIFVIAFVVGSHLLSTLSVSFTQLAHLLPFAKFPSGCRALTYRGA